MFFNDCNNVAHNVVLHVCFRIFLFFYDFTFTFFSSQVCKHDVVTSAISSMDRCAECVGPVAALKWIGLRCTC